MRRRPYDVNDRLGMLREGLPVVLILGAVVWGLWDSRHRLRPLYLWVAAGGAIVSLPVTAWLILAARSGEFSGWGGWGLVILLLPAAMVAALSLTALLTLALLLPRYGFNPPTPEQRAEARRQRRSPAAVRSRALRELKIAAIMLGVVLLLLKLRVLGP